MLILWAWGFNENALPSSIFVFLAEILFIKQSINLGPAVWTHLCQNFAHRGLLLPLGNGFSEFILWHGDLDSIGNPPVLCFSETIILIAPSCPVWGLESYSVRWLEWLGAAMPFLVVIEVELSEVRIEGLIE